MKIANSKTIIHLQRVAAKVARSSPGDATLSPLKSSLPPRAKNAYLHQSVTSRLYHTSLSDPSYSYASEEDLDAHQFGYRVVSPDHARRYTSTIANSSYAEDYGSNYDSQTCTAVTHNSLGQVGTFSDALLSSDVGDILASQREWDEILHSESHMEHFELLKEDPYLSDYEDLDEEWESDSHDHEVFGNDVFLGNEVKHYTMNPVVAREAINPSAMREAVWADSTVEADLCQACIH